MLGLVVLIALATPVFAQTTGRGLFEEAYRTEQENPARAIELYRQALKHGLDANLRRTARIRLKMLSRRTGSSTPPADAARSSFDPGAASRELRAARVPKMAIDNFFRGLRLLGAEGSPENPEPYMAFWRPALEQAKQPALRINMARALAASGKGVRAIQLMSEVDVYHPDYGIVQADLLLGQGRPVDARRLLLTLAARHDMKPKEKVRILYLLGRIARAERNIIGAVRYFRLAARYGDRGQRVRYRSLAAFTLFKANMPLQARGLMRGMPTKHNRNIRLLDLILRVQVDGEKKAREDLKAFIPDIIERVDAGRASFLEQRALEVMGRR